MIESRGGSGAVPVFGRGACHCLDSPSQCAAALASELRSAFPFSPTGGQEAVAGGIPPAPPDHTYADGAWGTTEAKLCRALSCTAVR